MRLVIVEHSHKDLVLLAERIELLSTQTIERLNLDITLIRDFELQTWVKGCDLALFGSGLGTTAADLVDHLLKTNPAAQMIVFVSNNSLAADKAQFSSNANLHILPNDCTMVQLEQMLLTFVPKDAPETNGDASNLIAGRYQIERSLGQGSYGIVYLCRHLELRGAYIAVKVLAPGLVNDPRAIKRFKNEIFAAYGVSHPNVIRCYEYIHDGKITAFSMEYASGGDLTPYMTARLPFKQIIKILSELCQGMVAIHDAGLVHRNLKPENILLSAQNEVKISDFCCACLLDDKKPLSSEEMTVTGTIDYVAPEYLMFAKVDRRSDIYAAGMLGFELITGESPFQADTVYATMTKRLKGDPEPPSKIRNECPAELDRIILKALARDPELRFQTAQEMLAELNSLGAKLLSS